MALYRHLTANNITLSPMPFLREIAMEAYLFENPDILALDTEDLSSVSIIDAEVQLPGGRVSSSKDGRVDLIAQYGNSYVAVIELKNCELGQAHLHQLEDYLMQEEFLKRAVKNDQDGEKVMLLGILVGTDITSDLKGRIENGYLFDDRIPIAAITLNRYRGNDNNIYVITDVMFKQSGRNYDRTRYKFRGEILGKNRLVLRVIQDYVESNPMLSFAELKKAFPTNLQGSNGCFSLASEAAEKSDSTGHRRHFLKPEELITLSDSTIAVSTQWGIGNIVNFLARARSLGLSILEI